MMFIEKFNTIIPKRDGLQACIICGRYFIKRDERVCSIACAEKAERDEQLLNQ
jgi:predicted nucleic acid-binding Zn ribbon protein